MTFDAETIAEVKLKRTSMIVGIYTDRECP